MVRFEPSSLIGLWTLLALEVFLGLEVLVWDLGLQVLTARFGFLVVHDLGNRV